MTTQRFNVGDLVRYGDGETALMRVTSVRDMGESFGGNRWRYYGRAFHSTGTCTGRYQDQCSKPSALDRELWKQSHDAEDAWIRGRW